MNLVEIIDAVRDALKSQGAEGDVYLEHTRTLHFEMRDGAMEGITRADVRGLGVRAALDSRLGFVHTNDLGTDSIAAAAKGACELARYGSQRDDLLFAPPSDSEHGEDEGKGLSLYDPEVQIRPIEAKQYWLRTAESAARRLDPKIKRTESAEWNETLGIYTIGNTNGLLRQYRKSFVETSLGVVAEDKGEMQPGELGFEGVHWKDLPDPNAFGRRAGERALRLLGARPVPTGRYPVVFSPEAGWTLLVYLTAALSGDSLSRGRSWLAGRLGQEGDLSLASPLVTVKDDGRLREGPASAPFDAEGVDTRETVLLEQGKVKGRLCDLASGKRLGVPSTGNAARDSYESLPGIRSHNLYMVPGTSAPEEILASVDRGLWVWGLSGWWIGLDPSNPNFSSAAFGLWIEKGKPVRPVARVTVAGRIEEILGGIDAVGADLVWDHPTSTPTFRVAEVSVSGE